MFDETGGCVGTEGSLKDRHRLDVVRVIGGEMDSSVGVSIVSSVSRAISIK